MRLVHLAVIFRPASLTTLSFIVPISKMVMRGLNEIMYVFKYYVYLMVWGPNEKT